MIARVSRKPAEQTNRRTSQSVRPLHKALGVSRNLEVCIVCSYFGFACSTMKTSFRNRFLSGQDSLACVVETRAAPSEGVSLLGQELPTLTSSANPSLCALAIGLADRLARRGQSRRRLVVELAGIEPASNTHSLHSPASFEAIPPYSNCWPTNWRTRLKFGMTQPVLQHQ